MKRLISWLLALTLICGLLPMSVFAVEIETGDSDLEVDFGELNPINLATVVTEPGATFEVTLEAGKSAYYTGTAQFAGMVATINGEKEVVLSTDDHNMVNLVITNDTDATETYTVEVNYPAGFWQNPVIIESMKVVDYSGYSHVAKVPAGQDKTGDYYYYKYIAEGDGTIDLSAFAYSVVYGATEEDVTYVYYTIDILVNNDLYQGEPVEVTEGEEITIQLIVVEDDQGNAFPGCEEVNFNGTFNYYAGHESNPIDPWNWTTSAEVTVPAGKTLYYTAWDGMTLTVNGEVVEHNGVFSITNDGAEDATYALEMIYPTGHNLNPEVIADANFSQTGVTVDDDMYYNYSWTAAEDGTLTLDVTENANITVVKTPADGSETVEYVLAQADIVYAADGYSIESITWNVAENLAIEVAEGDVLKIQVTGIDPESEWIVGGVNYTLTGSFEAAVTGPLVDENLKFQTRALSFQEEIVYQCIFNTGSVSGYDSFYVECTHYDPVDGEYTENLVAKKMGTRLQFKKNFLSWSMVDEIKITLYGVKGEEVYMGESFVTSVRGEALTILEAKKTSDAKTCRVLVDMLNYGAEVQKAFTHNEANLANADLGEYADFATTEIPAYSAQTVRGTAGTVKVNSLGISMQSKVEYQLVLAGSNENHELRAYVGDTLYATVPYADFIVRGSFRQAKLAIKAADMRTALQIAVYDKTTGEPVSEIITTCAEAFASANIGEGKTYNDVFIAMLKYGDSVSALAS